jgi:hypothetical protein
LKPIISRIITITTTTTTTTRALQLEWTSLTTEFNNLCKDSLTSYVGITFLKPENRKSYQNLGGVGGGETIVNNDSLKPSRNQNRGIY